MATAADVPVIVMSGYLHVCEEIEPLGLSYLQKPFQIAELLLFAALLLRCDSPAMCK